MPKKIDISEMTHEEVIAYAEKVKQQARDRVNRYYHNTVKNDPVKYSNYLQKCKKNNKTYYDSKQMRNEQSEERFLHAEEASERAPFEF
jgi:hypothetical protein